MTSFREIIDALTVPVLSEAFGVTESHVRTMRARDSIPPVYWPRLVDAAKGRKEGVTFEALETARRQALKRPPAAQAQGA